MAGRSYSTDLFDPTLLEVVRLHNRLSSMPEEAGWEDYLRAAFDGESVRTYLPEPVRVYVDVAREVRGGIDEMFKAYAAYQSGKRSFADFVAGLDRFSGNAVLRAVLPSDRIASLKRGIDLFQVLTQLVSCTSLEEFERLSDDPRVSQYMPDWAANFPPLAKELLRFGKTLAARPPEGSVQEQLLWIFDIVRADLDRGPKEEPAREAAELLETCRPYVEFLRSLQEWKPGRLSLNGIGLFISNPKLKDVMPPAMHGLVHSANEVFDGVAQAGQLYELYQSGRLSGSRVLESLGQAAEGGLAVGMLGGERAASARSGIALLRQLSSLALSTSAEQFMERLQARELGALLPEKTGVLSDWCAALMRARAFECPTDQGWLEWFITVGEEMTGAGTHAGRTAGLEVAQPFFGLLKSLRDWSAQGSIRELGRLLDSGLPQRVMSEAPVESLKRLSVAAEELSAVLAPAEGDTDPVTSLMRLLGSPEVLKLVEPYLPTWGRALTELFGLLARFPSEGSYIDQADWLFRARDEFRQYPSLVPLVAAIEQTLGCSEETLALLQQLLRVASGDRSGSLYIGLSGSIGGMLPASLAGSFGLTMLDYYAPGAKSIVGTVGTIWSEEASKIQNLGTQSWSEMLALMMRVAHRMATKFAPNPMEAANRYLGLFSTATDVLSGKSWHEVLKTASKFAQSDTDKALFIGGVLLPTIGWKLYDALGKAADCSTAGQVREELGQLADALTEYLPLAAVASLRKVIGIVPWLPVLRAIYQEHGRLPAADSWTGWLKNMQGLLARSAKPEIAALREQLEAQVAEAVSDLLVNGADSETWESAKVAASSASHRTGLIASAAGTLGSTVAWAAGRAVGAAGSAVSALQGDAWGVKSASSALYASVSNWDPVKLPVAAADGDAPVIPEHVEQAFAAEDKDRASALFAQLTSEQQAQFKTAHSDWAARPTTEASAAAPESAPEQEPATTAAGSGANWPLFAGISLETLGVTALACYALWQWRQAGKAEPAQDIDMREILVARPQTQTKTEADAVLPHDAVSAEIAGPARTPPQPNRKLPLLLGLAGAAAMAGGGVLLYRWASSGASAATQEGLSENEYQRALKIISELRVPSLDFIFYGEPIVEETVHRGSEATSAADDEPVTEQKANRVKRSIRVRNESIPTMIGEIRKEAADAHLGLAVRILDIAEASLRGIPDDPEMWPKSQRNVRYLLKCIEVFDHFFKEFRVERLHVKYRPILDKLWKIADGLSGDHEKYKVDQFKQAFLIRSDLQPQLETGETAAATESPMAEQQLAVEMEHAGERTLQQLEEIYHPILNPSAFIDDHIKEGIRRYELETGKQLSLRPDTLSTISVKTQAFNEKFGRPGEAKFIMKSVATRQYSLKEIVTGHYLYDLNLIAKSNTTRQVSFNNPDEAALVDTLKRVDLQKKMEQALGDYRANGDNRSKLTSHYKNIIRLRCIKYLDSPDRIPVYQEEVEKFLAGEIEAKEVSFNGAKLNGVFLIPVDHLRGVLFSVDEPGFFHVGSARSHYTSYMGRRNSMDFSTFPETETFKTWVFNKIPSYKAAEHKGASFRGKIVQGVRTIVPGDNVRADRPITFTATQNQNDLANKLFDGLMERLKSDIDTLVFTRSEQITEARLEIAKTVLTLGAIALNVAAPGSGTVLGRLALFMANLAIDATYVLAAMTQASIADRPEDAAAYRNEAIIAGVMGGVGGLASGVPMTRHRVREVLDVYRQTSAASGSAIRSLLAKANWRKLQDIRKIDLLVDTMKTSEPARKLAGLTSSDAVEQSIRRNLALDSVGDAKTRFTWGDFATEQAQAQRLLQSDLARLSDANGHIGRLLNRPLVVPREVLEGVPEAAAAGWITRSSRSAAASADLAELARVQNTLGQFRDANLLDITTIDNIHGAVCRPAPGQAQRVFRSSSDPVLIGSDIAHAGFARALSDIKIKAQAGQVDLGEELYAAIARYCPYGDGNGRTARTVYALAQLRKEPSPFRALTQSAEDMLNPPGPLGRPAAPRPPAAPARSATEPRRVLNGQQSTALPEEMRSYLSELQANPGINSKMLRPSENCEAILPEVVKFMKEKGMQNIRYRGMFIWSNGMDSMPSTHFVAVGSKHGEAFVFDLTAAQFADKGMRSLDGPLILSEAAWAQCYQTAATTKLMKYKDFDSLSDARVAFGPTQRPLPNELIEGGYVLAEPRWYKTMLGRTVALPRNLAAEAVDLNSAMTSSWNNPVRNAARDLMSRGSNSGVCWDYASDVLKRAGMLSDAHAASLARNFKMAAQGPGNINAILINKREISNSADLINVKPGELVVFAKDEKPVHVIVGVGNGRFSGIKNDYLDPRLGPSVEILTAEEVGILEEAGGVKLKFSGPQSGPHKVYVGYPKNVETSKIPAENLTDANSSRLKALLGPDSSINVVGGGAVMNVKVHGAPYIVNDMDASEFYHAIRGQALRPGSGMMLDQIRTIRLQSCFGAWGGRYSSAQIIANRFQKMVEACPYWIKQRNINMPDWWAVHKKMFTPMSGNALDDMKSIKKHMDSHNLWEKLVKFKAVLKGAERATDGGANIDNLLHPIAKFCSSAYTIDRFIRAAPSFDGSQEYLRKIVPFRSSGSAEIGDDEFIARCIDVIMCNESAYSRVDAFMQG